MNLYHVQLLRETYTQCCQILLNRFSTSCLSITPSERSFGTAISISIVRILQV